MPADGNHHGAASERTLADLFATDGGIYLGLTVKGGTDQRRPLAGKEDDPTVLRRELLGTTWLHDGGYFLYQGEGHIGIWGPQGSGKSRKVMLPNILRLKNWSKIIIDIKGELTAATALYLKQSGHGVHVIDPFRVIEKEYPRLYAFDPALFKSVGHNHVAALDPLEDRFPDDADGLAMAAIPKDDGLAAYWSSAGQALTAGALMALRLERPGVSDSLEAFSEMMAQEPEDLAKYIKLLVRTYGDKFPAIRANLSEFASFRPEDREIGAIRRTVKVATKWLNSPLIRADCRQRNCVDFASFKERPQTCFIILPPGETTQKATWLRLMINSALQPQLRSTSVPPVPVLFMIDEIGALGNMEFLSSNINLLRGHGVKLMTIWQFVSQVRTTYKQSWEAIMGACDVKLTFTSSEPETLEYFSRLSGERLYTHAQYSRATNTSTSRGTSRQDGGNSQWGQPFGGTSWGGGTSFNFSESETDTTSSTLQKEPRVWPGELQGLDRDEAVCFSRRGRIDRTILPQPHILPGIERVLAALRPLMIDKPSTAIPARTIYLGPASDPAPHRRPDPDQPPAP